MLFEKVKYKIGYVYRNKYINLIINILICCKNYNKSH
jgi:hypothetical protein